MAHISNTYMPYIDAAASWEFEIVLNQQLGLGMAKPHRERNKWTN
jgi:hypothetical protein